MELGTLNPYVIKILISARDEDSINAVSRRIGLSYGWTHHWAKKLMKEGVFKGTRTKLFLNKDNRFYARVLDFIKENFKDDVSFHYSVLSLFGVKYCFTKTDAVFVWTNGGYNISRFRGYYPIFIKLRESDKKIFEDYCKKLDYNINSKKGIFYSVEILKDFEVTRHRSVSVDSLEDTIRFMKDNVYNFEPALEMIQNAYKKDLGVKYAEVASNV